MKPDEMRRYTGASYDTLTYGSRVKIVDTANRNCEYRYAGRFVVETADGKRYIVPRSQLKRVTP